MAKQTTCHTCVYAHWDPGLWVRTLWSGFPAWPTCGNQPDSPGRMKECPYGGACRNYRARLPVPTGETVKMVPLTKGSVPMRTLRTMSGSINGVGEHSTALRLLGAFCGVLTMINVDPNQLLLP